MMLEDAERPGVSGSHAHTRKLKSLAGVSALPGSRLQLVRNHDRGGDSVPSGVVAINDPFARAFRIQDGMMGNFPQKPIKKIDQL